MGTFRVNESLSGDTMFKKALAKYYLKWFSDALTSADYCRDRGDFKRAESYDKAAEKYGKIISENKAAIEFFSVGDRAFLVDSALPEEFRGYE